jgi:hypothetical protein
MIKLLKIFAHVIQNILHRNIDLFHNSFINVSYDLLDHFELGK